MWVAPIRSGLGDQKQQDYEGALDDWYSFLKETKTYYGVDMSVLTKPFSEEQKKYYLQVSFRTLLLLNFNIVNLLKSTALNLYL